MNKISLFFWNFMCFCVYFCTFKKKIPKLRRLCAVKMNGTTYFIEQKKWKSRLKKSYLIVHRTPKTFQIYSALNTRAQLIWTRINWRRHLDKWSVSMCMGALHCSNVRAKHTHKSINMCVGAGAGAVAHVNRIMLGCFGLCAILVPSSWGH